MPLKNRRNRKLDKTVVLASLALRRRSGEQRYLILEYKVGIFKDLIHEDDEFTHDGGQGDFGRFASGAKALVKRFKLTVGTSSNQSRHVESAADLCATAANGSVSAPLAAITGVRRQTSQGGDLSAIQGSQFWKFGQNSHGRDGADAGDGFQFGYPLIQYLDLGTQLLELGFHLLDVLLEPANQAASLTLERGETQARQLLALSHEQVQELGARADQFGQLLFLLGAGHRSFGLEFGAVVGENGGIDIIGLGALAQGTGEVSDPGGIKHTDWDVGGVQASDQLPFITAGGFTDDVNGGVAAHKFNQPAMAGGSVSQMMDPACQVELQVLLGNIQASINSGHSVLAPSCKYELAFEGRSINGSSLGHRDGRLLLPTGLAKSQHQRASNSSAPLSCRLQAAGQFSLPKPSYQDKDKENLRYKRVALFCRTKRWNQIERKLYNPFRVAFFQSSDLE